MTNELILNSKQRAMAWGELLMETFQVLGITDREVITNCHIGRKRFYGLKGGGQINVDAYFRLMDYAHRKIHEKTIQHFLPPDYEREWQRQFWYIFFVS